MLVASGVTALVSGLTVLASGFRFSACFSRLVVLVVAYCVLCTEKNKVSVDKAET